MVLRMTWNNRIVHMTEGGADYYEICEVFYDDDGTPGGYTKVGDLASDEPGDIKGLVELIYRDIIERDMPILESEDL